MIVGVHDPDVLLRIVGADLHIVWPAPDLVPLRPVLFSIILPLRSNTTMMCSHRQSTPGRPLLPSAAALPPLGVALAVSRIGRPPPTGNLMLGPICGSQVVPRPSCKDRQLTLLRHEDTVGTLGKNVGGLRPGPRLMVGKALSHWPRPVRYRIVGTERVLPALESRHGGEPLSGRSSSAVPRRCSACCSAG